MLNGRGYPGVYEKAQNNKMQVKNYEDIVNPKTSFQIASGNSERKRFMTAIHYLDS
jgi:hypothetical protein